MADLSPVQTGARDWARWRARNNRAAKSQARAMAEQFLLAAGVPKAQARLLAGVMAGFNPAWPFDLMWDYILEALQ